MLESIRKLQELETKPKGPAPADSSLDATPPIIDVMPPAPPPPPSMREDFEPETQPQTPDKPGAEKTIPDDNVESSGAGEQSPR
ncbi:MAG TPA: hypothetical protein VHY20_16055 [Pirellulales bacterium]|nr:hypothetical protein [Pirellulales bacterium]